MKKIMAFICIMLLMMTTYVVAAPNPNKIIKEGYENPIYMEKIDNSRNFNSVAGQITVLLGTVGIGVGLCVGIIYAIMWITATPSKKADLKERMFPLILGIILLFGGTGIAATFISGVAGILQ